MWSVISSGSLRWKFKIIQIQSLEFTSYSQLQAFFVSNSGAQTSIYKNPNGLFSEFLVLEKLSQVLME